MPHAARPTLVARFPVHVTLRVHRDVPNLRRHAYRAILMDILRSAAIRPGFRICQFVIMSNHIHLIAEAENAARLSRGMQGLGVRLARRMNRMTRRSGRFIDDRYHAHILRTPTEVHRALSYVLLNLRKHEAERGTHFISRGVDPFSSGPWFTDWAESELERSTRAPPSSSSPPPVAPAMTWLLSRGWQRAGGISPP